jgi:hypothetical protein
MTIARALILTVVLVVFELVAFNLWPVTWLRFEVTHPDTCCLTPVQIVFGQWGWPTLFVLLTHGAALLVLNELARVAVVGVATLIRSPRTFLSYWSS